jgi:glyoxalase family protein
MKGLITGLHHVTALTSDAQENLDFYSGVLGLRLVKKTVNFDAPEVYHLYFGNGTGDPGTILTFFPYKGMPRGRKGNGQVTVTSFSINENSIGYWMKRLSLFNVDYNEPRERFQETYIYFEDFDGLGLELVANANDPRPGFTYGNIPEIHSVKGFHSVTLSEEYYERTAGLLMSQMDHDLVGEEDNRYRFGAGGTSYGFTDILHQPNYYHGRGGAGTIHHVAYATPDDKTQYEFREKLLGGGLVSPTPVVDRQYFHSVYFREPGGVLFEAATCNIGFTLDEPADRLGEELKLPPWEEKNRISLERELEHIELNTDKFSDAQIQHN